MAAVETDDMEKGFTEVAPRWVHSVRSNVANICWLCHLLKSNRTRLYESMCAAVAKSEGPFGAAGKASKIPFSTTLVAGDGRCGWR